MGLTHRQTDRQTDTYTYAAMQLANATIHHTHILTCYFMTLVLLQSLQVPQILAACLLIMKIKCEYI